MIAERTFIVSENMERIGSNRANVFPDVGDDPDIKNRLLFFILGVPFLLFFAFSPPMLSRINDTFFRGKKELWKKIIKCALAYEITFILILVPPVMQILSYGVPYLFVLPVIFFNASGTAGYQIEEIILNIVVLVPSAIFCGLIVYFCTLYNKALEAGAPLYSNGVAIIASFSYFVCVFTMAYTRVKYPRLFFASLHGLMLPFFALTRNIYSTSFSVLSIAGIVYPVLMGAVVSLLVNLCLWPETASKGLEISLGKSLTALHQVLNYLRDEMHGEPLTNDVSVSRELQRLNDALQASIDEMRKAQKEAKYEIVVSRYSPLWYKPVVRSIDKLAKHMLGISLAVERVNRIMIESKISSQLAHSGSSSAYRLHTHWLRHRHMDADHKLLDSPPSSIHRAEYKHLSRLQSSLEPTMQRFMRACTICLERVEKDLARGKSIPKLPGDESTSSEQQQQQQGTADASLASEQTIASGPADKQAAAAPDTIEDDHDSGSTADDLASALEQFWLDAETILSREYRDEFASPMEEHYLMYTINYALTAFGKELLVLDQQVQELLGRRPSNSWPRIFFPRVPLHKWLSHDSKNDTGTRLTDEQFVLDQQQELERQATRQSEMHAEASAGYTKEDSSSIISQPIPLHNVPGRHYWNNWLFRLNKWLRYGPTRYAIKFTVVMELLALMAWLPFPGVNDLYVRNHGQWAMLHSVVVSNFTVGATAQQCFFRIISTIIGAVLGYVVLIAGNRNENPYVIAVLILVFQVILWYIYLGTKYPRIGFISLLTMAIITSTGYADTYDERLIDPTWKRTLTAIIAIFVTIVVDQLFWPVWARKTMRKTLANLLLETGIQYSKVASLVCQEDMTSSLYVATARDVEKANKDLRRQLRTTTQMLGLVATEPRLTKGPFPAQTYRNILDLEKKILYWIQHLYEVQKFIPSNVRREITVPVSLYRKDLAAAVHLYLFTLAGSLRTKSSLPAVLPSAEVARQALQHQQGLTWKDSYQQVCAQGDNKSPNMEPLVYWHTYAAGSVEIIILQEAMGQLVANLMGQHVFLAATEDWINA